MPQQQGSSSMSETRPSQRFHSLNTEQVEVLHQVLSEVVPIHGRGNFPTLELRPRDIIIAVRARLQNQGIVVRDVRLNGSTASHVLIRDNGTSYKDLDVIFGVELPSQEEFQVIKESVLGCLLDCLPTGVNRERISSATMKEAYVQKMVKVFNEHDRWSLISLSNNSGKNLELKFVSMLRRQFEFSVDSFQIILDRLLESYMQQDLQHKHNTVDIKDQPAENLRKDSPSVLKQTPEAEKPSTRDSSGKDRAHIGQAQHSERHEEETLQTEHSNQVENGNEGKTPVELKDAPEQGETVNETHSSDQASPSLHRSSSEKKETSEEAEPPTQIELRHESAISDETKCSTMEEQIQPCDDQQPAHSNHKEPIEESDHTEHPKEELEEQMGPSELPKTQNESQTESLQQPEECHSECLCEDQRSNDEDKTAPDFSSSSHKKAEAQLVDEGKVESKIGEQASRQDETDISEVTEEVLDQQIGIDCSCSSISFTLHNTEPAGTPGKPESHSTPHTESSDKTPNSPPDTQDISPAPPGLVSDKKTSCSPSCKASERLSHMVVLKHSSPKPPRRMCRKMASNPCPSPVSESEHVAAPNLDPNPSPDPEIDFKPKPSAPSSDPTTIPTASISGPEPNPSSNLALNLNSALGSDPTTISTASISGPEPNPSSNLASNLTSAPDPAPDLISTPAVDPMFAFPQQSSQPITESSCETSIQGQKETESTCVEEENHQSPAKCVSALKQTEPLDSDSQEPAHTSEVELSDTEESGEPQTKKTDLNLSDGCPLESSPSSSCCLTPPVSCLTPPMLSFSPPCFTPATSLSSPPLSFSPTSSCLSSPPYLTPPMLSLSPPPLCLSAPSPCLSPPLLCLTPPVGSEDITSQVFPDMEPLILSADGEEQLKEDSPQPGTALLQPKDKKDQESKLSSPQVTEPVSFPITIPSSASPVLPHSEPGEPGKIASPEVSSMRTEPENKEVLEAITVMPQQSNAPPLAPDSVPAVEVLAESMYGDFEAAMDHLRYRLIATRNPEEIRGGGLLKYSNLLVRDYRPASETQIKTLERYMCSRFFIDFPDVQEQQRKILSYLKNHFIGEERSKYQYLMTLRRVVDDSTVCLMGHERRQTLNMITVLALKVLGEQNIIPNTDHVTCFYQPAPYLADHSAPYLAEPSYCSYYIPQGGSTLLYQPYPLHLHTQTGLV